VRVGKCKVGVRLLHRTTRRLKVTDSGRIYYDRIKVALGGSSMQVMLSASRVKSRADPYV